MRYFLFLVLGIALIFQSPMAEAFWNYVPAKKRPVAQAPSPAPVPSAPFMPMLPPYLGPIPSIAPICQKVPASSSDLLPVVAEVQQLLAIVGRDPGGFDGIFSTQTQAAVRAYQKDAGYKVDGCVTSTLIEQLRTMAPNPYFGLPGLSPDDLEAQVLLVRLGYYIGAVDGAIGRKTQAAISDFQRTHHVAVTGSVNETLLDQLRQAYAVRAGHAGGEPIN